MRAKRFQVAAAIGSGAAAAAAVRGGADLLLALNAGRFRNMGAPSILASLPAFDAAGRIMDFAEDEVLVRVAAPTLLGVHVWEERFDPQAMIEKLSEAGFAGAVNFPSVNYYGPAMKRVLRDVGRAETAEIELLAAIRAAGLRAMYYCTSADYAAQAAKAGIDMICLNFGWNVGGALGHRGDLSVADAVVVAREIRAAVKRANPDATFWLEGGPIVTAEDLSRFIDVLSVDGYVGGSTIDRLPVETSIAEQIAAFRNAGRRGGEISAAPGLVGWAKRYGLVGRTAVMIRFLERLRGLAQETRAVLILAEPGQAREGVIDALAGRRGARIATIQDADYDSPVRLNRILFGRPEDRRLDVPALGDPSLDAVVIAAPERLNAATQRKLGRAIADGRFTPARGARPFTIAPRLIFVSTAADALDGLGLDPHLADHLKGWTLHPPPLRERFDDLDDILGDLQQTNRLSTHFTAAARQRLKSHDWPGNERELMQVLGALASGAEQRPVSADGVDKALRIGFERRSPRKAERDRIIDALWRNGHHKTRTAAALGLSRKTLYNKLKKYAIQG